MASRFAGSCVDCCRWSLKAPVSFRGCMQVSSILYPSSKEVFMVEYRISFVFDENRRSFDFGMMEAPREVSLATAHS